MIVWLYRGDGSYKAVAKGAVLKASPPHYALSSWAWSVSLTHQGTGPVLRGETNFQVTGEAETEEQAKRAAEEMHDHLVALAMRV